MPEALAEGFRNFTWHIGISMARKLDPIARTRAYALPYGENTKIMLIDYPGASEYNLFSSYDEPLAVYPTWTPDDDPDLLAYLCKNPPGDDPKFYNNKDIQPAYRPIKGQKHRVVVHRLPNLKDNDGYIKSLLLQIRDLEAEYDVEIFVSGLISYDHIFSYNRTACDIRPSCVVSNNILPIVKLPSGKDLGRLEKVMDPRYKDWFTLLGFDQNDLFINFTGDRREWVKFNLRSIQWAKRNWDKMEPFVLKRRSLKPNDDVLPDVIFRSSEEFVLPGARARVMRNLGLTESEVDRFACDVCILHNTCKLYREGAVCTVKGAETVGLADAFGTRSADRIIDGLGKLLQRQAERLEDAMAVEEPGEPNPDVSRQINAVFANGVKLAKLIDPTLAGGASVNVNVGVGAGGSAAIVAQQDPRQITAQIVRELEAQGIPRDKITSEMLAGYFKTMGITTEEPAKKAAVAAKSALPALPEKAQEQEITVEDLVGPKTIEGQLVGGWIE